MVGDDGEFGVVLLELLHLTAGRENAFFIDNDRLDFGSPDGAGGSLEQMRIDVDGIGLGLNEGVRDTLLSESIISGDDGDRLGGACVRCRDPRDTIPPVSALHLGQN